jgi:hypothetical protein
VRVRIPLEERFWPKVDRRGPNECWPWLACVLGTGYGQISAGSREEGMLLAHRVAYTLLVGPIPDGLELDHLCRNRGCVNPAHLEPVTRQENVLRGIGISADNARKTHCKHGHEFTSENTEIYRGTRHCRVCRRASWRRWYAKKKTKRA